MRRASMAADPDKRLADLMRMMLGAATEGEALASREAFLRSIAERGLDLHDIAGLLTPGALDREPSADIAGQWHGGTTDPWRDAATAMNDHNWEAAAAETDYIPDQDWPAAARWLRDQDAIAGGGRRQRILRPEQREFVRQMCESAMTVRPSRRQCVWLVALVALTLERLQQRARAQAGKEDASVAEPDGARPPAPEPAAASPPRPKYRYRWPTHTATKDELLRWIRAVTTWQRHASRPVDQPQMPKLFGDTAVRVLICLAISFRSWTEHTRDGDVIHDEPTSAGELAAMAGVSIRSVRRALAAAQDYGFLRVDRPGGKGRGRRTVHRLVIPHPRQWHFGDRTAAARPDRALPEALAPPAEGVGFS